MGEFNRASTNAKCIILLLVEKNNSNNIVVEYTIKRKELFFSDAK